MNRKQTKTIVRIILIAATITSLFFIPWILVKAWIQPLPNTVQKQLDEAVDLGFQGIVVFVDEAGQPPSYYAAGWHDMKNKIPANPKALFKIASISKLYTAVAVTKLVHRGHLSLDSSLASYLPYLSGRIEHAEDITLRMMVQHRSGIPNFTSTHNYWAHPRENNIERLQLVLDQPASFSPNEGFEYSNTNYILLSEIMDSVLGYDHFQFIQEEILNRLNLKNTYRSVSEVNIDDIMSGYHVGHPLDLKADKQGMLATAEDVSIFIRALNDGSLWDEGEQTIYSSLYRYEHTGLMPGYQSIAKYHKDIDAVIVQFTTPTYFEGYNWNLSEIVYNRIVKILHKQNKH